MTTRTHRSTSLDSSVSSASTTELEARQKSTSARLLELEDIDIDEPDNGIPSPKSISITMDEYVSASIVGRSSYASGDLLQAVTQFNEALGIELQTELECLYDTNLGFVSGLVRREVEHRLHDSPVHNGTNNCGDILHQLADVYIGASSQSDVQPTKSKWYLRMGAALCVVNEWEKAKQVYKEGINMCKNKKDLKAALKNLIKLEQITSSADLPPEDRFNQPTHLASPAKSVQSLPARPHTPSPKLQRRKSKIKIRRRAKSVSAGSSPLKLSKDESKIQLEDVDTIIDLPPRSDSLDSDVLTPIQTHSKVIRTGSTDLPRSPIKDMPRKSSDPSVTSPLADSDGLIQIRAKRDKKFALNILNGKRNSFSGFLMSLGRSHPTPTISSEDKQLWTECFSPEGCPVASYQTMTTSAVAHMRKLSVEPLKKTRNSLSGDSEDQKDGGHHEPTTPRRMTFNAVNFTSMKIDSDDSELDDD